MEASTAADFARAIPGVPTVFGVRFPGKSHERVMFIREGTTVDDITLMREIASLSQPALNLEQILGGYKTLWDATMGVRGFESAYSEAKVVMCASERSNGATIKTVAPGFFIVHNRNFVGMFCPKQYAWSIEWIAVDPGEYRQVRLQREDEYLLADLAKRGSGLKNLRIRTIMDHEGLPDGEVGELYTVDEGINFGEVDSLWVVIGSPELYAGTSGHTFVFDAAAENPYCCWKLFSCDAEEEEDEEFQCPAREVEMFINARFWEFGPEEVVEVVEEVCEEMRAFVL